MEHLRAFIKCLKDKHPDINFPRASDEVYTRLTDVLTPHAMKIMHRDSSLFRSADAPQPFEGVDIRTVWVDSCLLYTSPSPRDRQKSRMPSSA